MGSRMVKHLLDAGNNVVVYDSNEVRHDSTVLSLRQQRLLCISKDISNSLCVLQLALMRAKDVAKENKWGDRLEVRSCPADLASDSDIPVVLTMLSNATGVLKSQGSRRAPWYYGTACKSIDVCPIGLHITCWLAPTPTAGVGGGAVCLVVRPPWLLIACLLSRCHAACKEVYLGSKGLFKVPGGPRASVFVDW